MRLLSLLLAPLALAACNQTTPSDSTATGVPSAPATMATTNATVEPVPTAIATSPKSSETPMPGTSTPIPATAPSSACGAGKAAKFIGKAATPDLRAQVIEAVGHNRIRWIGPDDAVTMDFSEARLNTDLDAVGKIKGFRCG